MNKSARGYNPEPLDFARDKLRRRGFTLVELLVVMTIMIIVVVRIFYAA